MTELGRPADSTVTDVRIIGAGPSGATAARSHLETFRLASAHADKFGRNMRIQSLLLLCRVEVL
jgi:cation diffusion facilitator CzcD-associated flavoprotein CzcO